MRCIFFVFFLLVSIGPEARAQGKPDVATATIAAKTAAPEKLPAYLPLYWDAKAGIIWLEAGAGPACRRKAQSRCGYL